MKIPPEAAAGNLRSLATGFFWNKKPSCLDSALERDALEKGLVFEPVFPENKLTECRRLTKNGT